MWIKFYPSLDQCSVGISTIVTSKSAGAPIIGSSPTLVSFITLPSGKPLGILILIFYYLVINFLPLQLGHTFVTCFPPPWQTGHVF